jgi:hypothetical protein
MKLNPNQVEVEVIHDYTPEISVGKLLKDRSIIRIAVNTRRALKNCEYEKP